jgi:hypothetical protein
VCGPAGAGLPIGRGWPGRDPGQVVFGDSLLGGQPAQQAGQLAALGLGQGAADLVLVAVSGCLVGEQRSRLGRSGMLRGRCPVAVRPARRLGVPRARTYSGQRRHSEHHPVTFVQVRWHMKVQAGAYCKTVGSAYVGSNPTPATRFRRSEPVTLDCATGFMHAKGAVHQTVGCGLWVMREPDPAIAGLRQRTLQI